MINEIYIDALKLKLEVFEEMYDALRIVDPLEKKVFSYEKRNNDLIELSGESCFDVWKRNDICVNCVSIRASQTKKTVTKFESLGENMLMVMATPVNLDDREIVVECMLNISHEGLVTFDDIDIFQLEEFVRLSNERVVKDIRTGIYKRSFIYERMVVDIAKSRKSTKNRGIILMGFDGISELLKEQGLEMERHIYKVIEKIISPYDGWVAKFTQSSVLISVDISTERKLEDLSQKIMKAVMTWNHEREDSMQPLELSSCSSMLDSMTISVDDLLDEMYGRLRKKVRKRHSTSPSEKEALFSNSKLTDREVEVARLLLQSYKYSEIAEELFIGLSTVKKHVSNIYTKMDVKSKTDFISKFLSIENG